MDRVTIVQIWDDEGQTWWLALPCYPWELDWTPLWVLGRRASKWLTRRDHGLGRTPDEALEELNR